MKNDKDHEEDWSAFLQSILEENDSIGTRAGSKPQNHPGLMIGIGSALAMNFALLAFSLPPVLRGRGAPYLPTLDRSLNVMFHHHLKGVETAKMTFVDLGSGDGRVVRRAAREGFQVAIGYEINPMLHAWAKLRQVPKTKFYCANLWDVPLHEADVVAVVCDSPCTLRTMLTEVATLCCSTVWAPS